MMIKVDSDGLTIYTEDGEVKLKQVKRGVPTLNEDCTDVEKVVCGKSRSSRAKLDSLIDSSKKMLNGR